MMTGQTVKVTGSIPNSVRISFCQPTWRHAENTTLQPMSAMRIHVVIVRARPLSLGICR